MTEVILTFLLGALFIGAPLLERNKNMDSGTRTLLTVIGLGLIGWGILMLIVNF